MFLDNSFTRGKGRNHLSTKMMKPISFSVLAPEAATVSIVGDFNQWNPRANPMARRPDGGWIAQVEMPHGHHRYTFLVDDKPVLDPRATGITRNDRNERVSLLAVS
jgi:1,4-alpha-glucan branching enzyme